MCSKILLDFGEQPSFLEIIIIFFWPCMQIAVLNTTFSAWLALWVFMEGQTEGETLSASQ